MIRRLQAASNLSTTTTVSVTVAATKAKSLLVAVLMANVSSAVHSMTTGTWTQIAARDSGTINPSITMWAKDSVEGETTESAAATAAAIMQLLILEYTGLLPAANQPNIAAATAGGTGITQLALGGVGRTEVSREIVAVAGIGMSNTHGNAVLPWDNQFADIPATNRLTAAERIDLSGHAFITSTGYWVNSRTAVGVLGMFTGYGPAVVRPRRGRGLR